MLSSPPRRFDGFGLAITERIMRLSIYGRIKRVELAPRTMADLLIELGPRALKELQEEPRFYECRNCGAPPSGDECFYCGCMDWATGRRPPGYTVRLAAACGFVPIKCSTEFTRGGAVHYDSGWVTELVET